MDFVTVGDPGNLADTEVMLTDGTTGYGSVGYTYRIGKCEVSESQWDTVVAANTGDLLDDPGHWSGDQPVAQISWNEAAMFCNWLNSGDVTLGAYTLDGSGVVTGIDRASAPSTYGTAYFLPTEDEWYKAAYYKGDGLNAGYLDYPTADSNLEGGSPPPDGFDSSGDTVFDFVFNDGHNQGAPNAMNNAGDLSPYGTMGQGGNVWEWNETLVRGSSRGVRGGKGTNTPPILRASSRYIGNPTDENYDLGFRVARDEVVPEPGSHTLLVSGALLALIRRLAGGPFAPA